MREPRMGLAQTIGRRASVNRVTILARDGGLRCPAPHRARGAGGRRQVGRERIAVSWRRRLLSGITGVRPGRRLRP
ncbi:MAG: hypothetical protein L0214_02915 [candidate division NC10 bacterium]|nr:hypothetical protein [candidate division NC10 bacterium]